MTWLTWRQFRTQAWVTVAALAVLSIVYAATGPGLVHLYDSSGIATCTASCDQLIENFFSEVENSVTHILYSAGLAVMFAVPGLIGIFWGAPLVARELETGTYRLVWNQSITRVRWLVMKLAGLGAATMVLVGLFSLAVSWWADPIDQAGNDRMLPGVFAARGIVPVGYAAFAFVVGVTIGMVLRRTVPAMAVTLAVVAAVQVVMPTFVRAHLLPPTQVSIALESAAVRSLMIKEDDSMSVTGNAALPGAWVSSNRIVTPSGDPFTGPADPDSCGPDAGFKACTAWLGTLNLREEVVYQPASRFWPLQWIETAIFLVVSTALAGFCFWWIRRRLI